MSKGTEVIRRLRAPSLLAVAVTALTMQFAWCETTTCDPMFESLNSCDATCDGFPELSNSLFSKISQYRKRLAMRGIQFQGNLTQFYYGNTTGGIEREFRYSGHGDYVSNIDFGALGIQEGLFLKIRAEHRFGESLAGATGAIFPSNLAADLPAADDDRLMMTNFLITQAFSPSFAVFAGKLDTLDGDLNAYAHARGIRQFSNVGFIANPVTLRTVPYSTLGCGMVVLAEDGEPLFNVTVLNATDTADTDGFSELFADGVVVSSELRLPTTFLNRPGHQLVGGTWSSRNYVALDQDPRIVLPSVPIARQSGSWSLYWNCDQALVTDRDRDWGFFARAGIADDDANPISYFLSAGLGGDSMVRGREGDTWGAGYYYSGTSDEITPVLQTILGSLGDGQGVELFYNARFGSSLFVTADVQVLMPARQRFDSALVTGIRANLVF